MFDVINYQPLFGMRKYFCHIGKKVIKDGNLSTFEGKTLQRLTNEQIIKHINGETTLNHNA